MDLHDAASVRNLEQIQEAGDRRSGSNFGTLTVVALSGACVLLGTLAFGPRRTGTADGRKADPLGALMVRPTPSTLQPGEVTFPGLLSDRPNPATALAAPATADPRAPSDPFQLGARPAPPTTPPPAADRLPVVPLPARHALTPIAAGSAPAASASPRAADRLTVLAEAVTDATHDGHAPPGSAPAGTEGGYQLQVSSFRTREEGDAFAVQLRARGHKAHVERAEIPNRGTWFRVRIGPFGSQLEANRYRSTFEAKEHLPTFVMKTGVDRY